MVCSIPQSQNVVEFKFKAILPIQKLFTTLYLLNKKELHCPAVPEYAHRCTHAHFSHGPSYFSFLLFLYNHLVTSFNRQENCLLKMSTS